MAQETASLPRHGNAYDMFILVLTLISLVIMVVMLLPLDDATIGLLQVYDNLICAIFLIDFFINLRAAPKKSDYLIKGGGKGVGQNAEGRSEGENLPARWVGNPTQSPPMQPAWCRVGGHLSVHAEPLKFLKQAPTPRRGG